MNAPIICGIDGSADSQAALAFAERLASRLGTRLILAHVAELEHIPYAAAAPFGGSAGRIAVAEEIDSKKKAAEQLIEEVADAAGLADAERRAAVGLPAERLADLADEEEAELIVVGSRGRGAFKAAFLGSVSNSLVGVARCPVVIVPAGATERYTGYATLIGHCAAPTERAEERRHVRGEQLGNLEGRKVSSSWHLGPPLEVEDLLGERARRMPDLAREGRVGGGCAGARERNGPRPGDAPRSTARTTSSSPPVIQ